MTLTITHDPDHHQFVAVVEDKTAMLKYSVSANGKTLDYYSTFVPPELRGRHVGEDMVKVALDYAKDNNYRIIPTCSFVKTYIDRHSEYKGILEN